MVQIFKTNVKKRKQAQLIVLLLQRQFPSLAVNFDLEDCDRILRVQGDDICCQSIISEMQLFGYACEHYPG
ncbi:hypothetical protein C7T94_07760 [Pedobacter yulinensis]|uniref:Uncharacterized protein n=1 Tax=Pedobacter yulinensis TaxID=2126353 RepID=A0A2T3HJD2_9SPHI|nr:hypothetical protein [Pedobacter yulinensis]PST82558.1 hypothetical protein C7T94_07760 [Pedobacter yulinensis]